MTRTIDRKTLTKLGIKLPPKSPRAMNKTEAAYAVLLDAQVKAGTLREYRFEELTLRLGDDLRYTPDFFLIYTDGQVCFHEVKGGFIRDDAKVKLKAAAAWSPFRFTLAQYKDKRWTLTEVET